MVREIVAGNIYHILSRGVDKRKIFLDNGDYFRFIHDLFEFNDTAPINNTTYRFRSNSKVIARPYIYDKRPRKLLVEILIFCLMPNHYHLLLRPRFDNGITKFMKRLNMGYARYFNEKYKRSGTLFEGRYKSVSVKKDENLHTDESNTPLIEHKLIKIVIEKEQYSNKNSELEKKRE